MSDRYHPTLQRLAWTHTDSGSVEIHGHSLSGNALRFTMDDAVWLNDMFPDLHFVLEEWDKEEDDWVESSVVPNE